MRNSLVAGLLSVSIAVSACTPIKREAGYPGGNLGYLADRHTLFAQGHSQRVDRYLVAMALLSPLIAETASTPTEAKLSAERLNGMYKKLLLLKTAAGKCGIEAAAQDPQGNITEVRVAACSVGQDGLDETAFAFETVSFEVAKSLNDALKQAFDNLNIKANISVIKGLSPSQLLRVVLRARHLVPVAMKYLATYRDVTMVFGASVLESCGKDIRVQAMGGEDTVLGRRCQRVNDAMTELLVRTRQVDDDLAKMERPINAVYERSRDAVDAGLVWKLSQAQAAALVHHVDRACIKLEKIQSIEFNGEETKCALASGNDTDKLVEAYAEPQS